ncbi:APC family permease [Planococcus glaciei]|uniref:APC family permease n=1 Tax=Planococcus glaciei TaxID=459472 RepID=UPI001C73D218|nr:APC family permease [Planococcus glaciei]MBX0315495.1 APC family permease [Planococcus glaciei]
MKSKSAYIVLAIGAIFVICAICRMFGYLIPGLVIALMSVMAALISLSDVIELSRFRKFGNSIQLIALGIFICSMTLWLLPIDFSLPFAQVIGDSFTILGLGFVIVFFGLKEVFNHTKEDNSKKNYELLKYWKFNITINEYDEMMKLNDIIERLKKLDQDVFPYNKVHNGWACFSDSLVEHWNRWEGPFFDGVNREKYHEFLIALDHTAGEIGNIADTDYRSFSQRKVEMWNESIELTIQPRINNMYVASIEEIVEEINKALLLWGEVKGQIINRYEKERSEQKE